MSRLQSAQTCEGVQGGTQRQLCSVLCAQTHECERVMSTGHCLCCRGGQVEVRAGMSLWVGLKPSEAQSGQVAAGPSICWDSRLRWHG